MQNTPAKSHRASTSVELDQRVDLSEEDAVLRPDDDYWSQTSDPVICVSSLKTGQAGHEDDVILGKFGTLEVTADGSFNYRKIDNEQSFGEEIDVFLINYTDPAGHEQTERLVFGSDGGRGARLIDGSSALSPAPEFIPEPEWVSPATPDPGVLIQSVNTGEQGRAWEPIEGTYGALIHGGDTGDFWYQVTPNAGAGLDTFYLSYPDSETLMTVVFRVDWNGQATQVGAACRPEIDKPAEVRLIGRMRPRAVVSGSTEFDEDFEIVSELPDANHFDCLIPREDELDQQDLKERCLKRIGHLANKAQKPFARRRSGETQPPI